MAPARKGEVRNPKGRTPGTKNKATLEREELAIRAMRSAANRKAMGDMLAREVLAECMNALWTEAKISMIKDHKQNAYVYIMAAADVASKLAPYESPRLQSITVHRADPFAAMSDEQLWQELQVRAKDANILLPPKPVLIEAQAETDD